MLGGEHHQEVAVLPLVRVGQQVQAEVLLGDAVVELEVAVQQGAVLLDADHGLVVALARDADFVRRRIDALDRLGGVELHAHGEVLQRARGGLAGAQRVNELVEAGLELERLRIGQLHLLLAVLRHGVDAHAEEVAAHVLQQAGVLHAADDILVDAARLPLLHQLAAGALAVDIEREVRNRGAFRQREDVHRLQVAVHAVFEGLLDLDIRHAVLDLDIHTLALDGQRRHGSVLRDQHARTEGRERAAHHCQRQNLQFVRLHGNILPQYTVVDILGGRRAVGAD